MIQRSGTSDYADGNHSIDHALGPSESFFAAMSERINEIAPEAWLFGEVTSMPSFNRRYGGLLDEVTDFAFAYGLREFLAGAITIEGFASLEREAIAAQPADEFSWACFFDNHDMERGLTRVVFSRWERSLLQVRLSSPSLLHSVRSFPV